MAMSSLSFLQSFRLPYGVVDKWVRFLSWVFIPKRTIFELGACDRQTDGQTEGLTGGRIYAPS